MIPPAVKICGLSTAEAVAAAADSGAAFLGFVHYPPSPRHVEAQQAASLAARAAHIPSVAVVVDPSNALLEQLLSHFTPAFLQLHGKESPARMQEIRQRFAIPLIKAFSIRTAEDFSGVEAYAPVADMFLFDAKAPATSALPGGNGLAFDWSLLAGKTFSKPWFLSGGLNAVNVEEAVRASGASLLDVSSGVESAPGVKSEEMIRMFIAKTRLSVR